MIKLLIGKYHNGEDDDLILTPAIVWGGAKCKKYSANAIALVWIRYAIGIKWVYKNKT